MRRRISSREVRLIWNYSNIKSLFAIESQYAVVYVLGICVALDEVLSLVDWKR